MSEDGTQQVDPDARLLFAERKKTLVKNLQPKENVWCLDVET